MEPVYRVMQWGVEVNRWHYQDSAVYHLPNEQMVAHGVELLPFAAFAKDMHAADATGLAEGEAKELLTAIASIWSLQFATVLPEDICLRLASLSVEQLNDIIHHWPADPAAFLDRVQHD